jgi:hypothetical protein
MSDKIITGVLAQLRHAYAQLAAGAVHDQKRFADGLIAPQIRRLEELVSAELEVKAGNWLTAYRQGTAIAPQTRNVYVVWVDEDTGTVSYCLQDDTAIQVTTLKRFREIITP